jgi:hypothetical protein
MLLRERPRLAVHQLLIVSMLLAGAVAPVAAAQEALASIASGQPSTDMPCDHMGAMPPAPATDPCAQAHCSLAVCLGAAACLPQVLRITASVPAPIRLDARDVPFVASGTIETPLRPPIA